MQPSRRHTSGSLRAVLRTVAAALAAATLLGTAATGPALASTHPRHSATRSPAPHRSHAARKSHASRASHKGWVKYYIVAPPKNGAKEFLFEIATATLGQGSKAQEIFKLNKGRLQPDGGRLEDPTTILPGWILILPPSAHGPGVHFGPLPKVTPSPSPSPSLSLSTPPQPAPVRHPRAVTPAAGPDRRVMAAGIGGALVLALLAIGLLLIRRRKSRSKPRNHGQPVPLPRATVLARDPAPPLREPAPDGLAGAGQPAGADPVDAPACPSWLALPASEDLDAAIPAAPGPPALPAMPALPGSATPGPAMPAPAVPGVMGGPDDENVAWPDFLNPADSHAAARGQAVPVIPGTADPGPGVPGPVDPSPSGHSGSATQPASTTQPGPAGEPVVRTAPDVTDAAADVPPWLARDSDAPATEPSRSEHEPELHQQRSETVQLDSRRSEGAFSPVALRLLGAQRSVAQDSVVRGAEDEDVPVHRHEIGLGDDRIEVVLAAAPAASQDGRPRSGHTWLTATPYLVWTPLPYEAPDGGTAFACLGAGDEGCLFIDLAAAPGAVAIGGDRAAAMRLAESIVHQLGMSPASGQSRVVIVVGAVVPEPHPAAALSLASLGDLASVSGTGAGDAIEIVFSELRSDEDAFALARYVASSQRRVVPVVLADLPDAPWSFTAQPSLRPSGALDLASA